MSAVLASLVRVTLRALLGRRRTILLLLLAGMPVLLGLIVRANGGGSVDLGATLDGLVVATVLPLVALVFGTAALGSELDDGTAIHVLTKPIPRWSIVLAKLAVAGGLTAALVVPSILLTGILLGGADERALPVTVAFGLAVAIGSFLYVAIFLALSVATSRGLIIGLAYSLIWEGLLAGLLPGSQVFSVREYLRGIAAAFAGDAAPDSIVGPGGFVYAAVVLLAAGGLASARLAGHEIRGTD